MFNEIESFKEVVINGNLYEQFTDVFIEIPNQTRREQAKDLIFKVFFCGNQGLHKEKQLFANKFPFVFEIMKLIKQKKNLSILLQKIESATFIHIISERLVNESIYPLTVHDSIIVQPHQVGKTNEIITNTFLELFQVNPQIKTEPFN